MTVALDLGTHEFRSLRVGGAGRLVARRSRTSYCLIDDSPAHRAVLEQFGVASALCEGNLVAFGDSVEDVARLLRVPCEELFPGGVLHATDPLTRQIAAVLVDALIGRATTDGELCALTLPADVKSGGDSGLRQREFFIRVVRLQGYAPLELTAPQALVLAELGNDAFTGVGLCFGAGSSQAGLIHRGSVLAHCAVPYAGNWIDLRMARARERFVWDPHGRKELDTAAARAIRESPGIDLKRAATDDELQLADLHRGMVEFLLREAAMTFRNAMKGVPMPGPMPVVISGGSARIAGFRELLCDVLHTVAFPVHVADVRSADAGPWTIARGSLIRAELETVADRPAAA